MTTTQTSRRAMLKGAAMLSVFPASVSAAGVHVFEIGGEDLPSAATVKRAPDLTTIEGRIAACCEWFDLAPPVLTYDPDEPGAVLLTDELQAWWHASGVSIDWLVLGEPERTKEEVAAQREERLEERWFVEVMGRLTQEERETFLGAVRKGASGEMPMEDALAECQRMIEAGRAAKRGRVQ